jgi:hypothetical protein
MASVYAGDKPASDAAVWAQAEKGSQAHNVGIAQRSLQSLREIGVLDEIEETSTGLLIYPLAEIHQ